MAAEDPTEADVKDWEITDLSSFPSNEENDGSQISYKDEILAAFDEEHIDFTAEDIEDLFNKNTESFRCLRQIEISRSSLLAHALYHFPALEDPGIDAAFNLIVPDPVYDDIGCERYKNLCKDVNMVPMSRVLKSLATSTMNLKYYGLTLKQIKAITQTLMLNNYVTDLILEDNWMEPEGAFYVGEMLRENNKIRCLNLRECRIGVEGAAKLSEGILTSQSLRELDLSFNELSDEGLAVLQLAFTEGIFKNLDLSHNGLGEQSGKILGKILAENKSLENLNLSWNNFYEGLGVKLMCVGLTVNNSIKSLNLAWNAIRAKEVLIPIKKYLMVTTILEHLDLSNNRIGEGPSLKMIRAGINKNTSLVSVKLGNNIITAEEALFLVKVFNANPERPLLYMDLENTFVNKDFVPVWKRLTKKGKSIKIGGVYSNYVIYGPNTNKLLFERVKYLAMKPKKKKAKKDFGHFILSLPEDLVAKDDFLQLIKKFKIKKLDEDVKNTLMTQFPAKQKVNLLDLKNAYMNLYPETTAPPPKPKKGKGGKKKKKKETTEEDASADKKDKKGKKQEKGQEQQAQQLQETDNEVPEINELQLNDDQLQDTQEQTELKEQSTEDIMAKLSKQQLKEEDETKLGEEQLTEDQDIIQLNNTENKEQAEILEDNVELNQDTNMQANEELINPDTTEEHSKLNIYIEIKKL